MFQISEILKKVPFFQTLSKDGIGFIIERLKFKPFEANETICKIGDPGDKMYIMISGTVKIVISAEGGEEKVIAHLVGGDYFGEMSLLTGEVRSATVVTTEPSEMFILHKADFDVIIEQYPSITLSMSKIMSQRLRETNEKAAKSATPTEIAPSVKGDLAEKPLVDVLKFCENNSLNGKVVVTHNADEGQFFYEKGELQKVVLDGLPEDQALDTMLNWQSGEFIIEPRPIRMDDIDEKAAPSEVRRIIIVNNSMVVQKMMQRAFDSMGYEVYAVETAAKALTMAKAMDPHIMIADTKLPDAGGVDLFNQLRDVSQIPFVLLTEASNKEQFAGKTGSANGIHFTNSPEIGEIVRIVEGVFNS